jgi:hypothetical protein
MALNQRQRWLVLGGLLALTLTAIVSLEDEEAADTGVVAAAKPERGAPTRQAEQQGQPEALALEALKRQLPEEKPEDAFSAKSWYVPPPPPKALPPPPPAPPPMPFTYMGRMVEEGKTTVFLTRQDRSYAIKVGDTIDATYRVDAIETSGVTFTYLPLNMQQTLATGGLR